MWNHMQDSWNVVINESPNKKRIKVLQCLKQRWFCKLVNHEVYLVFPHIVFVEEIVGVMQGVDIHLKLYLRAGTVFYALVCETLKLRMYFLFHVCRCGWVWTCHLILQGPERNVYSTWPHCHRPFFFLLFFGHTRPEVLLSIDVKILPSS